jgi:hypothetical protein
MPIIDTNILRLYTAPRQSTHAPHTHTRSVSLTFALYTPIRVRARVCKLHDNILFAFAIRTRQLLSSCNAYYNRRTGAGAERIWGRIGMEVTVIWYAIIFTIINNRICFSYFIVVYNIYYTDLRFIQISPFKITWGFYALSIDSNSSSNERKTIWVMTSRAAVQYNSILYN